MEERKGMGYKEGDRMVEKGYFRRVVERNFLQKNRGKKVMEQRGKKTGGRGYSRDELHSGKQGSCYRVYQHVGSGARKPAGFLGPAGSTLVGRVDHLNWHQGSDKLI